MCKTIKQKTKHSLNKEEQGARQHLVCVVACEQTTRLLKLCPLSNTHTRIASNPKTHYANCQALQPESLNFLQSYHIKVFKGQMWNYFSDKYG